MGEPLVVFDSVWKIYGAGEAATAALRGVSLEIKGGEFTAILGPSGSGKTSLIFLAAAIDTPSRGRVLALGEEVSSWSERRRRSWRRRNVGVVFQFFHLIPTLTALENVILAMELAGRPRRGRVERALELLEFVGLRGKASRYPHELSGGEQQRVALARALAHDPPLVLADEPTANLDYENKLRVVKLLRDAAKPGRAVVFATHDERLASGADRIVRIVDGRVVEA